jgi:hypothetical protein
MCKNTIPAKEVVGSFGRGSSMIAAPYRARRSSAGSSMTGGENGNRLGRGGHPCSARAVPKKRKTLARHFPLTRPAPQNRPKSRRPPPTTTATSSVGGGRELDAVGEWGNGEGGSGVIYCVLVVVVVVVEEVVW